MQASPTVAAGRDGRALDLLSPTPDRIDFDEIAHTLAHINRYNGCFEKPISVAQHTLIAVDVAPFSIKPWVLLHDCHEAFIGDLTRPTVSALKCIAGGLETGGGELFCRALKELRRRHDEAIHDAAGLPMPTGDQAWLIKKFDMVALATERRDFLAKARFIWGPIDNVQPATRRYGFRPPHEVGTQLAAVFRTLLPSLSDRSPR